MLKRLHYCWRLLRQLSDDDVYERYLDHYAAHHAHTCAFAQDAPLTKKEFFKRWQDAKWQGIKRCC